MTRKKSRLEFSFGVLMNNFTFENKIHSDMTGETTSAPYDPKEDEGGFGDVGRIMQVKYSYIIVWF